MNDHLPECPKSDVGGIALYGDQCLCPVLRACEQRVRDEIAADGPWFKSVVHQCCFDTYTAYADGLDAAREAVEIVPPSLYSYRPDESLRDVGIWKSNVLAAIDALREE